jgi:hypothetical protein
MNKALHVAAPMMALALAAPAVHAAEDDMAATFSGYGTVAATASSTGMAEFVRANQVRGAGKSPTTSVDSNLGIQGTLAATGWLSFTVQGLARKRETDDWGAELYWAYARAQLGPGWSVMAGRVAAPVFLISDYRNVGFANTMMRPPQEMYAQVPYDNVDGAALSYRTALGDTSVTAQLVAGSAKQALAVAGATPGTHTVLRVHGSKSVNVVAEKGPATLRFSYTRARLTADNSPIDTLTSALDAAGAAYRMPQLNALADDLAANGKQASFASAGIVVDHGRLLLQAEAGRRKVDAFIPDTRAWYVLGGYRFGALLPYAAFAALHSHHSVVNTLPAGCPAGAPAACTPSIRALSAAADGALASAGMVTQSTVSAGVRWNFAQSAAFKAQVDRVRPRHGAGLLANPAPGFAGNVTVYAAGADFLF